MRREHAGRGRGHLPVEVVVVVVVVAVAVHELVVVVHVAVLAKNEYVGPPASWSEFVGFVGAFRDHPRSTRWWIPPQLTPNASQHQPR